MEKKNLLPGTVGCAVASVCVHACAGGFGKLCGWGGGGAASASVLCWPLLPELGNESSQSPEERKLLPRVLRTRDGHVYVASNQLQSCTHKWQKYRGHPQGPHPQKPGSFTALPPMLLLLWGVGVPTRIISVFSLIKNYS